MKHIIYDCKTKQTRIEEIEVEDIIEDMPIIPQEPTLEEKVATLQMENIELKATNDTQDELINTTMLATDEMFMMLEPLLAEVVNLDGKRANPLLNMYVAMVERGLKKIEDVPESMRERVGDILGNKE